jgi:phosphatidate cytidylyltransferase
LLSHRLLSAAILIGSVLTLIYLDAYQPLFGQPGLWLAPAMLFLACGTAWEFGSLTASATKLSSWIGVTTSGVVILVGMVPLFLPLIIGDPGWTKDRWGNGPLLQWISLGCFLGMMLSATVVLFSSRKDSSSPLMQWSCLSLITIYCGGLGAMWIAMRLQRAPNEALLALIGISTIVKSSDAGAYFVGKSFGRTKLCPHISPGKTVEGAIGGFAIAMIVAIVFFQFFFPAFFSNHSQVPMWGPALLGLILGITGLIGDLIESMVKRAVGAKDSGSLLPGLGGIWDVTDSLLPTTIVGYLGMVAGWI